METVKFYSSKSNAKRAAQKAGLDMETAVLVQDEAGGFAYTAPAAGEDHTDATRNVIKALVDVATEKADKISTRRGCGHNTCPHCGIGLDNGLLHVDDEAANTNETYRQQRDPDFAKGEWMCMGCGEHFGEPVVYTEKGTGIKIEKDREERNGVKRPSIGGACRAVWDACDEMMAANGGKAPAVKAVKELAVTKGWNANNASIEYYLWRKFNGIRGRQ